MTAATQLAEGLSAFERCSRKPVAGQVIAGGRRDASHPIAAGSPIIVGAQATPSACGSVSSGGHKDEPEQPLLLVGRQRSARTYNILPCKGIAAGVLQ